MTEATVHKEQLSTPRRHPLKVTRATLDDMKVAAEIVRSTADWYQPLLDEKDMAEHDVDAEWGRRNFQLREFYIGRANGEPVGIVSLQDAGDYCYVGYVYVYEKHVGKGYGRRLLRHAADIAEARGKKGLVLIAHPEAEWAVRAYQKFGFRIVRRERDEVLAWNDGFLKPYYEEGFHLFQLDF